MTRAKGDCSGDIWPLREPLAILAGVQNPKRGPARRAVVLMSDIGSDELVQRLDDLLVFVGTTLGSFAG